MSSDWISEMSLLFESDPRQVYPRPASGMRGVTYDNKNSYNSSIGISDGSAYEKSLNNSNQSEFNSEMEEDIISTTINKKLVLDKIDNLFNALDHKSKLDHSALLSLCKLKNYLLSI